MFYANQIQTLNDVARADGPVHHDRSFSGKQHGKKSDVGDGGSGKHYTDALTGNLSDWILERKNSGDQIAISKFPALHISGNNSAGILARLGKENFGNRGPGRYVHARGAGVGKPMGAGCGNVNVDGFGG